MGGMTTSIRLNDKLNTNSIADLSKQFILFSDPKQECTVVLIVLKIPVKSLGFCPTLI